MRAEKIRYKKRGDKNIYTAYVDWINGPKDNNSLNALMCEKIPGFDYVCDRNPIKVDIIIECAF